MIADKSHILNRIQKIIGKPFAGKREVVLTVPARMDSSRFPGKVILLLAGKPAWWHAMRHCEAAAKLAGVKVKGAAVLTGAESDNDLLEKQCHEYGYDCIRQYPVWNLPGARLAALDKYKCDVYIELGCDTPFAWYEHFPLVSDPVWNCSYTAVPHWRNQTRSGDPRYLVFNTVGAVGICLRWQVELHAAMAQSEEDHRSDIYMWRNPENRRLVSPPRAAFVEFPAELWEFYRWYKLEMDWYEDAVIAQILYDQFYKSDEIIDPRKCITWLDAHPEYHYNRDRAQSAVNTFCDDLKAREAESLWLDYCEFGLAPERATKLYCRACGEYFGYVERTHDLDQLHRPDGSIVTGHARLSCRQGHFRTWQHTLERTITAGCAIAVPPIY